MNYNISGMLPSITPEIVLLLSASIFILIGVFSKNSAKTIIIGNSSIIISICLIIFLICGFNIPFPDLIDSSYFLVDQRIIYFKIAILAFYILTILIYIGSLKIKSSAGHYEYIILMQIAVLGSLTLVSAQNFLVMFLGVEMQALVAYVLAAFDYKNAKSSEAGVKYLILGALFSSITLFGISLIYASTHSLNYSEIARQLLDNSSLYLVNMVAIIMILAGIFFKLSIVPFHNWTLDVYEGAPIESVAFFSSCQKISIFALLLNLLVIFQSNEKFYIKELLGVLAGLSLLVGSLGALFQQSVKRIIAYSTILNLGYVLLALLGNDDFGIKAACIYIVIYSVSIIGIISLVISCFGKLSDNLRIENLSGIANYKKGSALMISIMIFSLIGLPPLAGFFAKYMVFTSILQSGKNYTLVFIGLISALIAAYYYLRIVQSMYFLKPTENLIKLPRACELSLVNIVTVTIIVGSVLLLGNLTKF